VAQVLLEERDHLAPGVRVEVDVGVEDHQVRAARHRDRALDRRHEPDRGVVAEEARVLELARDHPRGRVGAGVVDDEDLRGEGESVLEALETTAQAFADVARDEDDGDFAHRITLPLRGRVRAPARRPACRGSRPPGAERATAMARLRPERSSVRGRGGLEGGWAKAP
jgi:hypothetical protein